VSIFSLRLPDQYRVALACDQAGRPWRHDSGTCVKFGRCGPVRIILGPDAVSGTNRHEDESTERPGIAAPTGSCPNEGHAPVSPNAGPLLAATMDGLSEINTLSERLPDNFQMDWEPISTAPFARDLQLAVIDAGGIHMLVFPCRRVLRGWINDKRTGPCTSDALA
jgi:hypothetical protein